MCAVAGPTKIDGSSWPADDLLCERTRMLAREKYGTAAYNQMR
jgi:hypothetical protein